MPRGCSPLKAMFVRQLPQQSVLLEMLLCSAYRPSSVLGAEKLIQLFRSDLIPDLNDFLLTISRSCIPLKLPRQDRLLLDRVVLITGGLKRFASRVHGRF